MNMSRPVFEFKNHVWYVTTKNKIPLSSWFDNLPVELILLGKIFLDIFEEILGAATNSIH